MYASLYRILCQTPNSVSWTLSSQPLPAISHAPLAVTQGTHLTPDIQRFVPVLSNFWDVHLWGVVQEHDSALAVSSVPGPNPSAPIRGTNLRYSLIKPDKEVRIPSKNNCNPGRTDNINSPELPVNLTLEIYGTNWIIEYEITRVERQTRGSLLTRGSP